MRDDINYIQFLIPYPVHLILLKYTLVILNITDNKIHKLYLNEFFLKTRLKDIQK